MTMRQIEAKWKRPQKEWSAAKSRFDERSTLED